MEVIAHTLNIRVQVCDLADDDGKILQYQLAWMIRVVLLERNKVVANASANVDNEGSIRACVSTID
jgi:hypothetical protein